MTSSISGPVRRHGPRSFQSFTSSIPDKQPPPAKVTKPLSLAKRLLFPRLSPDADLPPLLLSPSATPELNEELYNFIAIALRAYIHPWWTRITRYDKEFLPAVTLVLTTVIRSLEARIMQTDLSPLMLRDVPALLSQHIADYHSVQAKLNTSYASGGSASLAQLFHQMQPHMAITAEGKVEEAYIRQAIDDILKACLPEEDLDADPERYIVREVIVKVFITGVIPRITQPWFLHQSLLTLLGSDDHLEKLPMVDTVNEVINNNHQRPTLRRTTSTSVSFQSLAIFILSTIRSISGACLALIHAYRHTLEAIKKVNESGALFPHSTPNGDKESMVAQPQNTIPGSLVPVMTPMLSTEFTPSSAPSSLPPQPPALPTAQPNYVHPSLHLFQTILSPPPPSVLSARSTPLAFIHVLTLLLAPLSSILSRLLPHLLYSYLFSCASLIRILQASRGALFPGGWPAVPPPDPTPEERVEIREKLVQRLLGMVPTPLVPVFGTSRAVRAQTIDDMLEPLSSAECNTHLVVLIFDLLLVTLFPEMGVSIPSVPPPVMTGPSEGLQTPAGSSDSVFDGFSRTTSKSTDAGQR